MKLNIYETVIHIRCPFQPVWDYYQVRFESVGFMQCETIEACCDLVRGHSLPQETVGDDLYREACKLFPGVIFSLTIEGRHGANCRTIVKR